MTDWRHDPDKRAAFLAGLHDLYNFYAEHPEFPLPYETTTTGSTFSVGCHYGADQYAETVHALGGRREKKVDNNYARMIRTFGPGVSLEVWTGRETVCERRVVDTVTEVVTALRCVHCGEPIAQHAKTGEWWHATNGELLGYRCCGTEIDPDGNEIGGEPATPPDFTAVSTTTTEVVEWECKPVLADAEAAG